MKYPAIKTVFCGIICGLISLIATESGYCADAPCGRSFQVWGKQAPDFELPKEWKDKTPKPRSIIGNTSGEAAGYLVWPCPNYADANQLRIELPDLKPDLSLELRLAGNEYEPVSFLVHAFKDLFSIRVSLSALVSENGDVLPEECVDLRIVRLIPRIISRGEYEFAPGLLERRDEVSLSAGQRQQFWITIYAPRQVIPGNYTGKLSVVADGKKTEIPVRAQILPFSLEKPLVNFYVYYNSDNRWQGLPGHTQKHFTDISEHGFTSASLYVCPKLKISETGIPKAEFIEEPVFFDQGFSRIMQDYLSSGLEGPLPYLGVWYGLLGEITEVFSLKEGTSEFDNIYAQVLMQIEDYRVKNNWPELLYSPEDEPFNSPGKARQAERYLRIIKKTLPQARTYMSYGISASAHSARTSLDPLIDVPAYPSVALSERRPKHQSEFWFYNGGSEGRHPMLDRFFFGFFGIKTLARGLGQWAYQWPATLTASPYDEIAQGVQGWYYTYPGADGPLPTLAWEFAREGIDDAKYYHTLRSLMEKLRVQASGPEQKRIIEKCEQDIRAILDQINSHLATPQQTAHAVIGYAPDWKGWILDLWRKTLTDDILMLLNALEKSGGSN